MTKSSRVTKVLVPGEQPAQQPAAEQHAPPAAPAPAPAPDPAPAAEQPVQQPADAGATAAPAVDLDALRAQIRAEEMAKLQAASTVIAKPAVPAPAAPRSKSDYRNMRAADVDPTTLTAPVLTLDGYVCPVAPTPAAK